MKILLIGAGGREHALAWKIAQSRRVTKIYCAPGNAGIAEIAECVPIKADDIDGLVRFAKSNACDLTCVGPELPLVLGIVDRFSGEGLTIFGPTRGAALLEKSKVYAKEIMRKYGVPTAGFETFGDPAKARAYVKEKGAPIVVKADGLAAGKGVAVCKTVDEALEAIDLAMVRKIFGDAGDRVVIEEALSGEEASILAIADGKNWVILDSAQDHKRVFDHDCGPNTGGMGAYSPAPVVTGELLKQIEREVISPMIRGMEQEGYPFRGVLYAGIMVTKNGPRVLEFNVRFGDPETQVILPRMKTDLVEIMEASAGGKLAGRTIDWLPKACVSVVLASGGYPGGYVSGKKITGIETAKAAGTVMVFHAGTAKKGDAYVTSGGRVLNVVGLGGTIREAVTATYEACGKINFEDMHYRRDIGARAIGRVEEELP
ncbi:MAG: phosphoribosylamine--glycine ligase [Candidatus Omnitrophica bacterium]|nr:phosphoribosylamine--glycine ligase [Candidatus Omnitrophota bacterium]